MSTSESCQENRTKDNATFMKAVNCYQLTPEKTQNEVIHQDHPSFMKEEERMFRPIMDGPFITQLGTGALSRRVFVIRTPTRLNENVVTSGFVQTKYSDLLHFLDILNTSSSKIGKTNLNKVKQMNFETPCKSFWPRALIWDFPMNRAGIASEYPKLKKLVLTYRVLDVASPTIHFASSLCGSLLFWLHLTSRIPLQETYAILSFYESDSIFLSLLGSVLMALDSSPCYSLDMDHISTVLKHASTIVEKPSTHVKKMKRTVNSKSTLYSKGLLSWIPVSSWRPSTVSFLHRFHRIVDTSKKPLFCTPYQLKSLFVNNFLGPTSTFCIEIYQLYDVNIVDGEVRRDPYTHEPLLSSPDRESDTNDTSMNPPTLSFLSETNDSNSLFDHRSSQPWEYWKIQGDSFCFNSAARFLDKDVKKNKKKSFTQRTLGATKRFIMSMKQTYDAKDHHLLGMTGYNGKSTIPDDACMQLRLLADEKDYCVMMNEENPNGTINLVANFCHTRTCLNERENEQQGTILSGDVIIVLRQKHPSFCSSQPYGFHKVQKASEKSVSKYPFKTEENIGKSLVLTSWSPYSRIYSPYHDDKSIFALYHFHTGFLQSDPTTGQCEITKILYHNFDIREAHLPFISKDLELVIVCENVQTTVMQPSKDLDPHTSTQTPVDSDSNVSTEAKQCDTLFTGITEDFKQRYPLYPMILEPWHSHLCKKNSQMSCYVDIKLEPLRWSKIAGKFLHYDIEAFLRHHPVKPREDHLVAFLKEGYSLFTSALTLKITDNDAWNALQLFLRFPQFDTKDTTCMTDSRCILHDGVSSHMFRFIKDTFHLNNENNGVVERKISHIIPPSNQTTDECLASGISNENASTSTTSIGGTTLCELRSSSSQNKIEKIDSALSSMEPDKKTASAELTESNCSNELSTSAEPKLVAKKSLFKVVKTQTKVLPYVSTTSKTSSKIAPKHVKLPPLTGLNKHPRPMPPVPGVIRQPNRPPLGRKIYWKPLHNSSIQGTIFEQLTSQHDENICKEPNVDLTSMVDSSHLNRLFVKNTKRATSTSTISQSTKTLQKKTILDAKRAQNTSIVLARLIQPIPQIVDNLHNLNEQNVTLDELDRVQSILLTPEEDSSFKSYFLQGGQLEDLREIPEQKLSHLLSSCTFRLPESIVILKYAKTYKSTVTSIYEHLQTIQKSTEEVRNSQRFRQILFVILRWGNYINYGVDSGDLYIRGFTLGSLLKITDFKTIIDSKITALHFLAANMLKTSPDIHVENLANDMPTLELAAKTSSEAMKVLLDSIREGLNFIQSEILFNKGCEKIKDALMVSWSVIELRLQKLEKIELEASEILKKLNEKYAEIKKNAYITARFFGDDTAHQSEFSLDFPHEIFFGTLQNFVTKFSTCCKEVARHPTHLDLLLTNNILKDPKTKNDDALSTKTEEGEEPPSVISLKPSFNLKDSYTSRDLSQTTALQVTSAKRQSICKPSTKQKSGHGTFYTTNVKPTHPVKKKNVMIPTINQTSQ